MATKKKSKWVQTGQRIMDVAYLRDGDLFHTGEALVLACLLHAKGRTQRGDNEVLDVQKIMNDPNLDKPRAKK